MRVSIGKYPGTRSTKERRVSVRIDPYDTWNMDQTLALIIHPMLVQLKENKHGSPLVADSDVPDHLRSDAPGVPPKENEWDTDSNFFARWDWVLDEMIWAFEQLNSDWENQFHSGDIDIRWIPHGEDTDGEELLRIEKGPKDTHVFDKEGYDAHLARIQNGLRLFGTYYMSLWD